MEEFSLPRDQRERLGGVTRNIVQITRVYRDDVAFIGHRPNNVASQFIYELPLPPNKAPSAPWSGKRSWWGVAAWHLRYEHLPSFLSPLISTVIWNLCLFRSLWCIRETPFFSKARRTLIMLEPPSAKSRHPRTGLERIMIMRSILSRIDTWMSFLKKMLSCITQPTVPKLSHRARSDPCVSWVLEAIMGLMFDINRVSTEVYQCHYGLSSVWLKPPVVFSYFSLLITSNSCILTTIFFFGRFHNHKWFNARPYRQKGETSE